jgi:hypothetical protein
MAGQENEEGLRPPAIDPPGVVARCVESSVSDRGERPGKHKNEYVTEFRTAAELFAVNDPLAKTISAVAVCSR